MNSHGQQRAKQSAKLSAITRTGANVRQGWTKLVPPAWTSELYRPGSCGRSRQLNQRCMSFVYDGEEPCMDQGDPLQSRNAWCEEISDL